jgi:hypothetical protein
VGPAYVSFRSLPPSPAITHHNFSLTVSVSPCNPRTAYAPFTRLSFLLSCFIYMMVGFRIRAEIKAAIRIKRNLGSFVPFLNSIFTQLELTNLLCNLIYFFLRVYAFSLPERRHFDPVEASLVYTDVSRIGFVTSCQIIVRATSIFTACCLYFKYLILMPKTSSWYLTGTTLSRSGTDFKAAQLLLLMVGSAWAIIFEQYFGPYVADYNSFFKSFCALVQMADGSGDLVTKTLRHRIFPVNGHDVLRIFMYIAFYFSVICCILPLFLAILRDAYTVRNDQLRNLRARVKCAFESSLTLCDSHWFECATHVSPLSPGSCWCRAANSYPAGASPCVSLRIHRVRLFWQV